MVKKIAGTLLLLLGLVGLLLPVIQSRIIEKQETTTIVRDFEEALTLTEEEKSSSGVSVYDSLYAPIGVIYIPSIDLSLPIYKGLDEYALSKGVGTMEKGSDLSGKLGTHSALSSHNGLSSSGLFTNLEEVQIGETFYIKNTDNKILKYKVVELNTVLPHESEKLQPDPNRSLSTLITCVSVTGINTHRLLVTGELEEIIDGNVSITEVEEGTTVFSLYEKIVAAVLGLILIYLIASALARRVRREKN